MSDATTLETPAPVRPDATSTPAEGNNPPPENLMPRFSVSDDGQLGENWHQSNLIPEALRGNTQLARYNTVQGLVTSLVQAQKMVGADRANFLFKPGENATPEEKTAFYQALGVPEKGDLYKIETDKLGLPEGMSLDDVQTKEFLDRAATEGKLTNEQANWVMREYVGVVAKGQQEVAEATERMLGEAESALRADPDWKDFDGQMGFAQKAWRAFSPAEPGSADEEKLQLAFRSNPAALKMLARVGKAISEDTLRGTEAGITSAGTIDDEIAKIKADPAYMDSRHGNHQFLVDRMTALMKRKYPEQRG